MNRLFLRDPIRFIRNFIRSWFEHENGRSAAVIGFYTLFSIAPIVFVAIVLPTELFSVEATERFLTGVWRSIFPEQSTELIQIVLENRVFAFDNRLAAIVSVLVFLYGATHAFAELHLAVNRILGFPVHSRQERVLTYLRGYMLSVIMILGTALLMLLLIVATIVLDNFDRFLSQSLGVEYFYLYWGKRSLTLLLTGLIVSAFFQVLPVQRLPWRHTAVAVLITTLLFEIEHHFIGLFIGRSLITSIYGTAGSLLVIVIWVFYSVQILLLGAEICRESSQAEQSKASQP